jgi:hypothetical protein
MKSFLVPSISVPLNEISRASNGLIGNVLFGICQTMNYRAHILAVICRKSTPAPCNLQLAGGVVNIEFGRSTVVLPSSDSLSTQYGREFTPHNEHLIRKLQTCSKRSRPSLTASNNVGHNSPMASSGKSHSRHARETLRGCFNHKPMRIGTLSIRNVAQRPSKVSTIAG